jgi:hypothetical protein
MLKYASASLALLALSNPALAATCASPVEASALKTAVLQQELMVAALQCRESGAYNRFVNTFRPELQSSDAALKAFFVRRGGEHGEAGYDAFKTKAANLSALEQARDGKAFCADAHALFQAALAHHGSLVSFVDTRSGAADVANICVESRPGPVLAKADDKAALPIKAVATAAAAPLKIAVAAPQAVAVAGVPAHSLPAIPYRHEEAAPPPAAEDGDAEPAPSRAEVARAEAEDRAAARQRANDERDRVLEDREAARNEEEADDAATYAAEDELPPRPPRYWRVRARPYQNAYAPRSYGPPRGWQDDYRDYAPPPPSYYYRRGYGW